MDKKIKLATRASQRKDTLSISEIRERLQMIPIYKLKNGRRYGLILTAGDLIMWLGGQACAN